MKRLLLVPLLLGLLISNSALAGRPDPKKKLIKQQQEEYISTCNNSGEKWSSDCNKILKININQITNQTFIDFKKIESRKLLNKCFKYSPHRELFAGYKYETGNGGNIEYGKVCSKIIRGNYHLVDWIDEELTIKDYAKVKLYSNYYLEALNNFKAPEVKSISQIRLDSLRFCESLLKENLKDPSSYKRLNSRDNQIATGYIRYSATNSFGGRVQEVLKCFDP